MTGASNTKRGAESPLADRPEPQPTLWTARTMKDFGTAAIGPLVKPLGLRPERMFFPLGVALVHSMFLFGIWCEISAQSDPSGFMHSWLGCEWVAILAGLYLVLVFVGPGMMEGSKPADIKECMVVYNFYQMTLNGVMVACLVIPTLLRASEAMSKGEEWSVMGPPVEGTPALVVFGLYIHFNNKFVEYLDTIFMVLRHKHEQMSFLHCWHHFVMGFAWFCVLKNAAGGAAWWGSTANSVIHVIMYGYYGCRIVGIKLPGFIKAAVTQAQLVQFCLVACQSVWLLASPELGNDVYPTWLTLLQLGVMVNMFVMFAGFYARQYLSGGAKGAKAAKPAEAGKPKRS